MKSNDIMVRGSLMSCRQSFTLVPLSMNEINQWQSYYKPDARKVYRILDKLPFGTIRQLKLLIARDGFWEGQDDK